MNLYELDEEIKAMQHAIELHAIETGGEIPDDLDARLESLQIEKERKISNLVRWYKNEDAIADTIENEYKALKERTDQHKKRAESIKRYLSSALNGSKWEDKYGAVSWRKSKSVQITCDPATLPPKYVKVEYTPKKRELRDAIESGAKIDNVTIEEKNSISIR